MTKKFFDIERSWNGKISFDKKKNLEEKKFGKKKSKGKKTEGKYLKKKLLSESPKKIYH